MSLGKGFFGKWKAGDSIGRMTDKIALITGVTGQDGAYLAELLLSKGYIVHGIKRRSSSFNTDRVDHLYQDQHEEHVRFTLHYGDMTDATNLIRVVQDIHPTEIYNLAAQSHVQVSFETPEYTGNADALGPLRLLEAILGMAERTRFYQASTSELYGNVNEVPQRETTPFCPRSPYGVAKLIKPQEGRNKSITITGANDSTAVVMPNHPRDFSVLCADCDDRPPRGSNSAHFASDDEALELRL